MTNPLEDSADTYQNLRLNSSKHWQTKILAAIPNKKTGVGRLSLDISAPKLEYFNGFTHCQIWMDLTPENSSTNLGQSTIFRHSHKIVLLYNTVYIAFYPMSPSYHHHIFISSFYIWVLINPGRITRRTRHDPHLQRYIDGAWKVVRRSLIGLRSGRWVRLTDWKTARRTTYIGLQ